MTKETLINLAKGFIDKGFYENRLKKYANEYIEYKFNESIIFARITEIHFDVFRKQKNYSHKMKAMTIMELVILASDILDDIQDQDAHEVPWGVVDNALNLNVIIGIVTLCIKESA